MKGWTKGIKSNIRSVVAKLIVAITNIPTEFKTSAWLFEVDFSANVYSASNFFSCTNVLNGPEKYLTALQILRKVET